jgi:hypothetical protein
LTQITEVTVRSDFIDTQSSPKRLFGWLGLLLMVLMFAAIGGLGASTPIKFAFKKNFCSGDPSTLVNPGNCTLSPTTPMNTPVYYTFTLTNPWSMPQQTIDIIDPQLSNAAAFGFVPSGPIFCKDDLGAVVTPVPSTVPGGVVRIVLDVGRTVTCFAPGKFTTSGTKKNFGEAKSKTYTQLDDVETQVLGTTPLNADLSVTKKANTTGINVSTGAGTVTYTIEVKNNGPADIDVGNWFMLHDRMSLLPNSVPLNVAFVSATCAVTAATTGPANDCLDPAGPNLTNGNPVTVGTMGYHNLFNWQFASGSNGHLQAGATMTLTIVVQISQIAGLNCTKVINANGLRNETFFTLANANSALTEINPTNNTSAVNLGVETGQTLVNPDCAAGQMKVTKVQVTPTTTPVPWGTPVTYKIVIENTALPAQKITIGKNDLTDFVTEGVNTPPFTRSHVSTKCEPTETTDPADCAPFPASMLFQPKYRYTFYGEANLAWETTQKIVLDPGEKITFYTTFIYNEPDCETVPNAPNKPIINTAQIKYEATPLGAPSGSPRVSYVQSASATTLMERQPACRFVVTKVLANKPAAVQFGVPLNYRVSFTNAGPARTIGTVIDVARIAMPNYATSLPFTSTSTCTRSWGGAPTTGTINGTAVHTSSPAQGSPTINLGSNIAFPAGGTITCDIRIVVQRPPLNDAYCTSQLAIFENLALMDVTDPFNSNIAWPPSGNYTLGAGMNPKPQDKNWATAEAELPKCWNANINKSATVGDLPTNSAPWTYAGNNQPINYTITTTNTAQSPWAGPAAPGFVVKDGLAAPYTFSQVTSGACASIWCWPAPAPHNPRWQIGIKNLAPGASGIWTLVFPSSAVLQGQDVNNRACVEAQGPQAGPSWYNNAGPISKCSNVTVPVIQVTKISVRKQVEDLTGAGVTTMGQFKLDVACTPYAIPNLAVKSSLHTTNATGFSGYVTTSPVPMNGTCSVSETQMAPIPAAMAARCGGAGNVQVTSNAPIALGTLNPTNNSVTVKNTYRCKPPELRVQKTITNPPGFTPLTNLLFSVTANCSPGGSATQTVNNGSGSGSVTFPATAGASCVVTENQPMPAFPASANQFCAGKGFPVWNPPSLSPTNGSVTVGSAGTTVAITNSWKCSDSPRVSLQIVKDIIPPTGGPTLTGLNFGMNTTCIRNNIPSNNTATLGYTPLTNSVTLQVLPNSTCTVSETTPLPAFPANATSFCALSGKTPAWKPPTTNPTNGTVAVGTVGGLVNVTNSWECVGSSPLLTVNKVIQNPQGATPLSNLVFGVTANCSPGGSSTKQLSYASQSGTVTFPVQTGANCAITEMTPLPNFPASATSFCAGTGQTPAWNPPSVMPNNGIVSIGTSGASATISNSWKCVGGQATGQLEIIKKLTTTQFPVQWPASAWLINTTCTPTGSASSVTINTSASGNAVITGSGSVTAPVGSTCVVNEPTSSLPAFPGFVTNYCAGQGGKVPVWNTPTYTPSSGVTITNGVQTVTVNNSWSCQGGTPGPTAMHVIKQVVGPPAGAVPVPTVAAPFVFNTNCIPALASPTVTVTTSTANGSGLNIVMIPSGTSCQFTETQPTFPATVNQYCTTTMGQGSVPVWDPPTWSIPQPMTPTASASAITVTNKWKCTAPTVAQPKPKPKVEISIGIQIPGIFSGPRRPKRTPTEPQQQPREVPRTPGRP